jgi:hypothetical protein
MKKITFYAKLTLILILLSAVRLIAAEGDAGYAGAFFQIPIGARPTAMGGAYLAISNDGAAPLFNPAGVVTLKNKLFATSYRTMHLDRSLGYLTFLLPTREQSVLGINWHYFNAGKITLRNSDGREIGEDISFNNHDISLLFAKRFEEYLSVGMRAGYIYSKFAEMSTFSIGIDLGAMVYLSSFFDRDRREDMFIQDLQVGLTVKNMAAKYRWNTEKYNQKYGGSGLSVEQEDRIPIEVGLGVSSRFLKRKLLVATDLIKNEKQNVFFHGGAEYFITPEFALRGGYSDGRLTAGTGYIFKLGKQVLAIDYAFATDKVDEGSEHIFSFDLLF